MISQAKIRNKPHVLRGVLNFRDMGGYPLAGGRVVSSGKLFRSGMLSNLTHTDKQALAKMSLTHVLDLRDRHEAQQSPDALWEDVFYECVPANPQHVMGVAPHQLFTLVKDGKSASAFMCSLYRSMPFDNNAFRQMINWLQTPNVEGLLLHCAIGKDRTGVASAILLLALGAPRATIVQDYLKTEEALADYRERAMTIWNHDRNDKQSEAMAVLYSARLEFIEAALDEILLRYSTFDTYLKEEYNLDRHGRTAIRKRFSEG